MKGGRPWILSLHHFRRAPMTSSTAVSSRALYYCSVRRAPPCSGLLSLHTSDELPALLHRCEPRALYYCSAQRAPPFSGLLSLHHFRPPLPPPLPMSSPAHLHRRRVPRPSLADSRESIPPVELNSISLSDTELKLKRGSRSWMLTSETLASDEFINP